jgi:ubiquinone/menaquinone biosynthesis C-methylase UbiE
LRAHACPPQRYRGIAPFYDPLAWLYSGGQIGALKRAQTERLVPGWRVLYAGGGGGVELEAAVARGVNVTWLDRSPEMLAIARRRPGASAARFVDEDILSHAPGSVYDAIVANFFLNVFSPEDVFRVLRHLSSLLVPGGVLIVGDFAPASKNPLGLLLQWAYYLVPLVFFWLATGNAFHGLYDYRKPAASCELEVECVEYRRVFGWGPRWLCSMTFKKVEHADFQARQPSPGGAA